MRLQVLSVLASVALAPSPTRRPHIVIVLGDDIGFANVGFNRPVASRDVSTPRLDQLAKDGIHLLEFYAFKYCSPSRCALQSGRNPIHINVVNGQTTVSPPVSSHVSPPVLCSAVCDWP
jgi:arylsulfatase I/J